MKATYVRYIFGSNFKISSVYSGLVIAANENYYPDLLTCTVELPVLTAEIVLE